MSHPFKCLDFNKKGVLVSPEGVAKATNVTGLGKPGIFLNIPGNAAIPDDEFCKIIKYFLTNYDLGKGDPRLELVKFVKNLEVTEGWNPGRRKLWPAKEKRKKTDPNQN